MLLLILVVTISLLGALLYWNFRARYRFADKWPTLKPVFPILGNGPIVIGKNEIERFEIIRDVCFSSDRILKVWAGPKLILLTSHPDLIQQVLTSPVCLEKPYLYDFAGFEEGLFTAKYHVWKPARKRLNPAFNLRIINGFVPIMAKCAQKMAARLNQYDDGATVNIINYTNMCTLDMICGTTLGSDVLNRDGKDEFKRGLDGAFNGAAFRMLNVYLYPDIIYKITRYYKELKEARRIVCDFFTKLILEKKQILQQKQQLNNDEKKNNDEGENENDNHKPKILIDLLLSNSSDGKPFTQSQITDNVYAVITGAVDTTALITAHACLFMSFYPEIQERVFAEINQYFPVGSEDQEVTHEQFRQLTYTEMFLNEVQRHWTPVPVIARENMDEFEIDGVKVPQGHVFGLSLHALHRRKDVWGPDADKFDPENFSAERVKNRHPFAFLPFSGGTRICLGWRYASFSMKAVMVYLVRNFKFSTKIKPEDIRFRHDLTMKLAFEHFVQITKRNPTGN